MLTDSLAGKRGGVLPWALLAVGSVASLAANVAVAEPTAAGRVMAAWPSLALISATSCSCARSALVELAAAERGTVSRPSSSDRQATGRWRRPTPVGSVER